MTRYDIIVVGAGIAGSTSAVLLGRQGFSVLLLDKALFPREKICGEGLMPAGATILQELGVLEELSRQGARPFQGIHFCLPGGNRVALNFQEVSETASGWITPRVTLDSCLARLAEKQPSVTFRQGFAVQSIKIKTQGVEVEGLCEGIRHSYTARVLVGADGIHSRFHCGFGIRRHTLSSQRFALSTQYCHFKGPPNLVEVHCRRAGEAYVAPLGDGRARITLLLFKQAGSAGHPGLADFYFEHLKLFPELVRQVKNPYPEGPIGSTSPVSLRVSRCHASRLILVGDAAGAVDPVTGQGMTIALKDAQLACRVLEDRLPSGQLSSQDLATYSTQREAYFGPSFKLARLILSIVKHPFLAHRASLALARNSAVRTKVVRMAVEMGGSARLTRKDQLHLLAGI